MGNLKKESGITLIALIVTIIVLLILAGISITMLTSENGILAQAQKAKEQTEKASEEEQRQLAMLSASMNQENYDYYDKNNDKAIIPAGFAPTGIEGEDVIEDGLVITDSDGNEFVWIPVENPDNYKDNDLYLLDVKSVFLQQDNNYLPNGISIPEGKTEQEIEKNMITNEKIKGFYISRYEAGDELASEARTNESEEGKLVSKKNVYPYNWITQEDSKEKSKEFINNSDVKSGLITSIQYDLVMAFINGKNDGNGETFDVMIAKDTRHRNSGIELTGKNEADKVGNSRKERQLKLITNTLDLVVGDDVIVFSSVTGDGREELLKKLEDLVIETI